MVTINLTCKQCRKDYSVQYKRRDTSTFCTKGCASKYAGLRRSDKWKRSVSLSMQGRNNPMWGITQTNPNSLRNLDIFEDVPIPEHLLYQEINHNRINTLLGIE